MNMRILKGTVIGGIAFFFLGYLIYGMLLMGYFEENMEQCAQRAPEDMIWWAMIVSNFLIALLLTLVLNWSGAKSVVDGLKKGALLGLIVGSGVALSYYSMSTMYASFSVLIVDVLITAVMLGLVGMLIVLTWGKKE